LVSEKKDLEWEIIRRTDLPQQLPSGNWIIVRNVIFKYADQPLSQVFIPATEWTQEKEDRAIVEAVRAMTGAPKEIRRATL
jgi:hypothetical protein